MSRRQVAKQWVMRVALSAILIYVGMQLAELALWLSRTHY